MDNKGQKVKILFFILKERRNNMANCIVCGKECCEECKKKYRNDKRRKEHPDKVCKYCGKSFSPKKIHRIFVVNDVVKNILKKTVPKENIR